MKLTGRFQWSVGVGLILLSISHWFPSGINILELLSAFAHFTFGLALFLTILAAVFRLYLVSLSGLLSALICGSLVIPHFGGMQTSDGADFTVGQFNLYHHNTTPKKAISEIISANADVFAIQELNSEWRPLVDSLLSISHPYKIEEYWDECCYGLGLYSRYPLASVELKHFQGLPYVDAVVIVRNDSVRIISFHTAPPVFPNRTADRNAQMRLIAEQVRAEQPTFVFGDLNMVPWDAEFKRFLDEAGLFSVRNGFQATFPTEIGIPLIPIDHITYSRKIIPTSSETVNLTGSDHKGLVAGFAFAD